MSTLLDKKIKKILLVAINAKYIHSNLGVYSLQAYGEKMLEGQPVETDRIGRDEDTYHADIQVAEYTINQDMDKVISDLYDHKPDLIAFSCYIWNISYVKSLIGTLRQLLPDTAIWLGGPEVSYHAEDTLRDLAVDGIMVGEGEAVFAGLIRELRAESPDLTKVPGIVTENVVTEPMEPLPMDELPFIYRDWEPERFSNRIIYYETSRGCPYRCSYCLSSVDKHVRFRSMELVLEELQFFLDHKVKQVKFVDRTFNCDDKRAIAIWKYLRDHDNQITNFHFEIAATTLSDEALELISTLRPGLIQLESGVQTTNIHTLQLINRHDDYDRIGYVSTKLLQNQNIHLHLDLIAGLPEEDYDSFARSFSQVYLLKPHELQLGFLKVLKGTKMEEEANRYGIKYHSEPPYEVLMTKDITYDQLRRLKAIAEMLEIYYNSNQFVRTMEFLLKQEPSPFALYARLADYYHEKGYDIAQPSRSRRYDVLLDFYRDVYGTPDNGEQKLLEECLIYDLYARENLKSRPAYAGEALRLKDLIPRMESAGLIDREEDHNGYRDEKWSRLDYHGEAFEVLFGEPVVCLFDYKHRDPVTGNVRTKLI